MPVYTFRCLDTECGEVTEAFLPVERRNSRVRCEVCDGPTNKVIMETPHVAFDWKAYSTEDDGMKLVVTAGKAGKPSPINNAAGGRV